MSKLIDIRPTAGVMLNVKPQLGGMVDVKPKVGNLGPNTNRVYERTLGAGMYMGLPFLLTYPEAITVISPEG